MQPTTRDNNAKNLKEKNVLDVTKCPPSFSKQVLTRCCRFLNTFFQHFSRNFREILLMRSVIATFNSSMVFGFFVKTSLWCILAGNNPGGTYPLTWKATYPKNLVAHRKTLSRDSWLLAKYRQLHCLVGTTNNAHSVPTWQWTVEWSHSIFLS